MIALSVDGQFLQIVEKDLVLERSCLNVQTKEQQTITKRDLIVCAVVCVYKSVKVDVYGDVSGTE